MTPDNDNQPRLISMRETGVRTSMSRTLITALYREGRFPLPVQLGERRIAFVREEIERWIDAQIAGRRSA